jgi:hypothetical protein
MKTLKAHEKRKLAKLRKKLTAARRRYGRKVDLRQIETIPPDEGKGE